MRNPLRCLAAPGSSNEPEGSSGAEPDKDTELQAAHLPFRTLRVPAREWDDYVVLAKAPRRDTLCLLPVLSPLTSRVVLSWMTFITLFDMTYTAFLVPLSVAFSRLGQSGDENWSWFPVLNIVAFAFYAIDMVMEFHTGILVKWNVLQVVVLDTRTVSKFYMKKGTFLVDLLSCLSFIETILALTVDGGPLLRLLLLLRLVRLIKVLQTLQAFKLASHPSYLQDALRLCTARGILIFTAVYTLMLIMNLLGCIWWWLAELQGVDNSWASVMVKDTDLLTASTGSRWTWSVYFSMTTVTTIGYGDITPYTTAEAVVVLFYQLIGVGTFAYLIGVVQELMQGSTYEDRLARRLREKISAVDAWMSDQKLTRRLRGKIRGFYLEVYSELTDASSEILGELPAALRRQVVGQLQTVTLRGGIFARGLDPQLRLRIKEAIVDASQPAQLLPGQVLCTAGDPASQFFVVDEGKVALTLPGEPPLLYSLPGPLVLGLSALFGDMAADCRTYMLSAVAATACSIWRVEVKSMLSSFTVEDKALLVQSFVQTTRQALEAQKQGGKALMPPALVALYARMLADLEGWLADVAPVAERAQAGDAKVAAAMAMAAPAPQAAPSAGELMLSRASMELELPDVLRQQRLTRRPMSPAGGDSKAATAGGAEV